ncbi:MAG: flagellar assembly protein FliH, partial [SAR324 cluster bacterium]|nr:flagellar assembly protein FliH [SAR324 cluster bacterium]
MTDFSVADAASENTESISTPTENLAISDQIESFKPLTFEEEEVSEDFISKESNGFQEVKTDAEKIQLSEDFKNSEFFLENSLLTDAEEFAETIREGAKLHKAQLLKQIEEQANDTDRIHQKTVAENQAAEQQRKQLLSETANKVQQIKDDAYKEGFEAGRLQGMQQRYDEAEPLAQQVNKILEQLDSLRKVVRFQAEEE